ncbi:hypothetical protein BX666DRAFT_2033347 [Dichotomocladium elegans]|nr:hypothetical protein BX666DRAFT_2033347 [Dichotomocladium elegans]
MAKAKASKAAKSKSQNATTGSSYLVSLVAAVRKVQQTRAKEQERREKPLCLCDIFQRLALEESPAAKSAMENPVDFTAPYNKKIFKTPGKTGRPADDYKHWSSWMPLTKKIKIEGKSKMYRTITVSNLLSRWNVLLSVDIPLTGG